MLLSLLYGFVLIKPYIKVHQVMILAHVELAYAREMGTRNNNVISNIAFIGVQMIIYWPFFDACNISN